MARYKVVEITLSAEERAVSKHWSVVGRLSSTWRSGRGLCSWQRMA